MTGSEYSARHLGLRLATATWDSFCSTPFRPPKPPPESRIEDDSVLPEEDDPWFDDEDAEDEGPSAPEPKRPFWNR